MKKILQEFKQFAMRGNVVDMAVGIIIGEPMESAPHAQQIVSIHSDIELPKNSMIRRQCEWQKDSANR